jgi:hypothetical protein
MASQLGGLVVSELLEITEPTAANAVAQQTEAIVIHPDSLCVSA